MKRFASVLILVLVIAAFAVAPVFALDSNPPAQGGIDLNYVGQLLQALILAVVPVLLGSATKWAMEKAKLEKARLTNEQQWALDVFIKTVVYAAEQMQLSGIINGKLEYAEGQVQAWLNRNKIYLDVSEIRARIEAAVFSEFNNGFELDPEIE